jgi:hypothetical protein
METEQRQSPLYDVFESMECKISYILKIVIPVCNPGKPFFENFSLHGICSYSLWETNLGRLQDKTHGFPERWGKSSVAHGKNENTSP